MHLVLIRRHDLVIVQYTVKRLSMKLLVCFLFPQMVECTLKKITKVEYLHYCSVDFYNI